MKNRSKISKLKTSLMLAAFALLTTLGGATAIKSLTPVTAAGTCTAEYGYFNSLYWEITADCELILGEAGYYNELRGPYPEYGDTAIMSGAYWPWHSQIANIKTVRFAAEIHGSGSISYMFSGAKSLTNIDGLSNFNTSYVTDMSYMFHDTRSLISLDLSNFNTEYVTNMSHMFDGASSLTKLRFDTAYDKFNTCNVTDMSYMFHGTKSLTVLNSYDSSYDSNNGNSDYNELYLCTYSVTDMSYMFSGVSSLPELVLNFDTFSVTNMNNMFEGASSLTELQANFYDTSNVTSMHAMFFGTSSLQWLTTYFDTSSVTDMSFMFSRSGISYLYMYNFNTSNVTNMSNMFSHTPNLSDLDDLYKFDTSSVTNMSAMFSHTPSLRDLDLSNFNTSNVTNMSNMFYEASGLTSLDLSSFDTSNVTDMTDMFFGTDYIKSVTFGNDWTEWINDAYLMTPPTNITTGKWVKSDNSLPAKTPAELYNELPANLDSYAGTWVWDVKYKVNHWQQKANGNASIHDATNYELVETDNLSGAMGSRVTPDTKTYANFTSPAKQTVTISEGGGTVVNYYYVRAQYSVNFDGNGATSGSTSPMLDQVFGSVVTLNANGFEKTGYDFAGWNTKADGTGTAYADKASFIIPTEDTTFYAQWTKGRFIVTFSDGAGNTLKTEEVDYGSAATAPADPSRPGYDFAGWDKDFSNITSSLTVNATWSIINYSISYDLVGGIDAGNPTSYNVESNTITLNNPTKTGYTFTGWTGSNGSTPQLEVSIPQGSTGDKNYTANWSINKYSVIFDGNGATDGSTAAITDQDFGSTVVLTNNGFTKTGYNFTGWNTKADGTGTAYANQVDFTIPAEDTTLYAQWTVDPNYNPDDPSKPNVPNNPDVSIDIAPPATGENSKFYVAIISAVASASLALSLAGISLRNFVKK